MTYTVTVADGRGRYVLKFRRLSRALDFARVAMWNNRSVQIACEIACEVE